MNATQTETANRPSVSTEPSGTGQADAEGHLDAAAEDSIDKDELFHLLKSERRRRALRYLLDAEEEPVRMRTLAEEVAATEYDTTVDALSSDERQRVYITLYQSHLPQLDRAGVIDYNQSRGRITTNPLIEAFDDYLDGTRGDGAEDDHSGRGLLAGLAGFGAGAFTALALLQAATAFGTLAVVTLALATISVVGVACHGPFDNGIKDRTHKPASTN